MADEMLEKMRDIFEGPIDFEGQRLCEKLATILAYSTTAIAVLVGYFLQDIWMCMYIMLGGGVLTLLVVVPPWPFYNQNPVKWLPIGSTGAQKEASIPQTVVLSDNVVQTE